MTRQVEVEQLCDLIEADAFGLEPVDETAKRGGKPEGAGTGARKGLGQRLVGVPCCPIENEAGQTELALDRRHGGRQRFIEACLVDRLDQQVLLVHIAQRADARQQEGAPAGGGEKCRGKRARRAPRRHQDGPARQVLRGRRRPAGGGQVAAEHGVRQSRKESHIRRHREDARHLLGPIRHG